MSELICRRCLQAYDNRELDRLLWCESCIEAAKKRSAWKGWVAGAALFTLMGLYVLLWVQPSRTLIPAVWVALLAAVFYLGARFAREAFFGWERIANRPAVEAAPPDPADEH